MTSNPKLCSKIFLLIYFRLLSLKIGCFLTIKGRSLKKISEETLSWRVFMISRAFLVKIQPVPPMLPRSNQRCTLSTLSNTTPTHNNSGLMIKSVKSLKPIKFPRTLPYLFIMNAEKTKSCFLQTPTSMKIRLHIKLTQWNLKDFRLFNLFSSIQLTNYQKNLIENHKMML